MPYHDEQGLVNTPENPDPTRKKQPLGKLGKVGSIIDIIGRISAAIGAAKGNPAGAQAFQLADAQKRQRALDERQVEIDQREADFGELRRKQIEQQLSAFETPEQREARAIRQSGAQAEAASKFRPPHVQVLGDEAVTVGGTQEKPVITPVMRPPRPTIVQGEGGGQPLAPPPIIGNLFGRQQEESRPSVVDKSVPFKIAPKPPGNEIALQRLAQSGDANARAILDRMQADKIRVAQQSRPPKDDSGIEGAGVPLFEDKDNPSKITGYWYPKSNKVIPAPSGGINVKPTTESRNRAESLERLTPAIDQLDALSKRVITAKTALEQRTGAIGRSFEAALANDPDYRVYQDARIALAGNLAVAQQGSRPSDADIKAVWLPLIPDVFKDTQDSAKMKWDMIRVTAGLKGAGPNQPTPKVGDRKTFPNGKVGVWDGQGWVQQ